jgi:DNA invertase Pin-like site-specific DNA recombinase
MRIAIYGRVSTLNHGQDVGMQLRELREYAGLRGWKISSEYVDKGQSGAKDSRPELNRLMSDAHQRKFDGVLVWKIDRFGRSLKHLVNAIADLQEHGVAFVSLKDNIDLSTSAGRLMFNVIAAMAEFERDLIRERVKSGLKNAAAKGHFPGRPKTNRSKDKDAAVIRKLRDEGQSYGEIGIELGRSKSDVYRVCMTLGCASL